MPRLSIELKRIRDVSMKRPGMWQDFVASGELRGDRLEIERAAFDGINDKYFRGLKAGRALHRLLKPLSVAIDAVLGTGLGSCGGCAGRELILNEMAARPSQVDGGR